MGASLKERGRRTPSVKGISRHLSVRRPTTFEPGNQGAFARFLQRAFHGTDPDANPRSPEWTARRARLSGPQHLVPSDLAMEFVSHATQDGGEGAYAGLVGHIAGFASEDAGVEGLHRVNRDLSLGRNLLDQAGVLQFIVVNQAGSRNRPVQLVVRAGGFEYTLGPKNCSLTSRNPAAYLALRR